MRDRADKVRTVIISEFGNKLTDYSAANVCSNVPGGNIRHIALGAAFLAADCGRPVQMVDLLRAARAEYAKLERPLTGAEIAGWV